jgi:hypothetical protein
MDPALFQQQHPVTPDSSLGLQFEVVPVGQDTVLFTTFTGNQRFRSVNIFFSGPDPQSWITDPDPAGQ